MYSGNIVWFLENNSIFTPSMKIRLSTIFTCLCQFFSKVRLEICENNQALCKGEWFSVDLSPKQSIVSRSLSDPHGHVSIALIFTIILGKTKGSKSVWTAVFVSQSLWHWVMTSIQALKKPMTSMTSLFQMCSTCPPHPLSDLFCIGTVPTSVPKCHFCLCSSHL